MQASKDAGKTKPRKSKTPGGELLCLAAKVQGLEKELARALAEADRFKDLAARAQADLQNARIRMEKHGGELRAFAVEGLLTKLLPTIGNLKRAFGHLPEDLKDHEWVKGLFALEQALMNDLQAVGLTKMNCLGKPVDVRRHEVLQVGEGEKDTVVRVLEDGYELHGKVLRAAKVVAGNNGSTSSPQVKQ